MEGLGGAALSWRSSGSIMADGLPAATAKEIAADPVADRLEVICAAQFNRDSEKNAKLKEMKEKDR